MSKNILIEHALFILDNDKGFSFGTEIVGDKLKQFITIGGDKFYLKNTVTGEYIRHVGNHIDYQFEEINSALKSVS